MERGRIGKEPARLALPDLHRGFARRGAATAERVARLSRSPASYERPHCCERTGLDRYRRTRRAGLPRPAREPRGPRTQARPLCGVRLPGALATPVDLWARPNDHTAFSAGDQINS